MFCNIVVISCHAAKNRHFLQFSLLLPLFIHRVGTIFPWFHFSLGKKKVMHRLCMTFEDNELLSTAMLFSWGTGGSPCKENEGQRMGNLRFSSIAKRYATGISFTVRSKIAYRRSPRARTPAAYFKARSRPFGNPSSFLVRVTVYRRQGGKVRTPHSGCVLSGAPGYAGTAL